MCYKSLLYFELHGNDRELLTSLLSFVLIKLGLALMLRHSIFKIFKFLKTLVAS